MSPINDKKEVEAKNQPLLQSSSIFTKVDSSKSKGEIPSSSSSTSSPSTFSKDSHDKKNKTLLLKSAETIPKIIRESIGSNADKNSSYNGKTPEKHSIKQLYPDDDVSEEFVNNFNAHIGNVENREKVKRLIEKMKILGGIINNSEMDNTTDIPRARVGLAILSGIDNKAFKIEALKNLQKILTNTPVSSDSAEGLVDLAIQVLAQMNRESIQKQVVEAQIEIAKTYATVAEQLIIHYVAGHINAMTQELKFQLANSAKALRNLNRLQNAKLSFHVGLALEAINRLKDDRKELYELMRRAYHASLAVGIIAGLANGGPDGESIGVLDEQLQMAFSDIHVYPVHNWYEELLFLHKECAKVAIQNIDGLQLFQYRLGSQHLQCNWRYLYAGIETLGDIVLRGSTKELRQKAYFGSPLLNGAMPGLISFINFNKFHKKIDTSPIIHFEKPGTKDHNKTIRMACYENLGKISIYCPDSSIRKNAKTILLEQMKIEKEESALDLIIAIIPEEIKYNAGLQKKWIKERKPYNLPQFEAIPSSSSLMFKDKDKIKSKEKESSDSTSARVKLQREAEKGGDKHLKVSGKFNASKSRE